MTALQTLLATFRNKAIKSMMANRAKAVPKARKGKVL